MARRRNKHGKFVAKGGKKRKKRRSPKRRAAARGMKRNAKGHFIGRKRKAGAKKRRKGTKRRAKHTKKHRVTRRKKRATKYNGSRKRRGMSRKARIAAAMANSLRRGYYAGPSEEVSKHRSEYLTRLRAKLAEVRAKHLPLPG